MSTFATVKLSFDQSVAVLTLNRPEALNALSLQLCRDFLAAFTTINDAKSRAVLVTGAGRAFCAGGDLREMHAVASSAGGMATLGNEYITLLHECILAIREYPAPVIAAVNGAAFGAGCNLALACDLVYAGEGAQFNESFVRIGLATDCGGTFILPRLIGWRRATELLMTGANVSATEALRLGMINRVVPDEELSATTFALAARLAQAPTIALANIKRLLDVSATNDYAAQLDAEREAQARAGRSRDFMEGVTAFLEKRQPKFSGE